MNYPTNNNCHYSYVNICIHEKCLIVNLNNKNKLYGFKEADLMILELSKYVDKQHIDHMKGFIEDNCSKVKFSNNSEPPEQLSLF